MRWATRSGVHVDRAACIWLVRRCVDADAAFVFVDDPDEVPEDATPFDMRGVELSHHGGDCTFETMLRSFGLDDPVLWDVTRIVHEADLADERFDAPEAIWFRDADVADAIDAVLFVGLHGWYPPNYDCGACGYATCVEFLHATKQLRDESTELEFAGPTCNLRDIDLGIAVGSDRRIADLDLDSFHYPPTGTLPLGIEGRERHAGVRNRQQPRRPIRQENRP